MGFFNPLWMCHFSLSNETFGEKKMHEIMKNLCTFCGYFSGHWVTVEVLNSFFVIKMCPLHCVFHILHCSESEINNFTTLTTAKPEELRMRKNTRKMGVAWGSMGYPRNENLSKKGAETHAGDWFRQRPPQKGQFSTAAGLT